MFLPTVSNGILILVIYFCVCVCVFLSESGTDFGRLSQNISANIQKITQNGEYKSRGGAVCKQWINRDFWNITAIYMKVYKYKTSGSVLSICFIYLIFSGTNPAVSCPDWNTSGFRRKQAKSVRTGDFIFPFIYLSHRCHKLW